ncbi:envelope glycoprotein [Palo verde broom virus]|uniref:Envelope glycoprotein n=1 Tax=Palo verde broom virus TaxID=2175800 RepID=A0A2S1R393_9VIRU|nr:envelope glycoprotein [Palo verde broom virus]AWH90168.1 envelope glycoprotein [Palo verde broom virus]AWH90169.1 envelope glycoprotein [Palo verde broom virus]AWH90171.1 envelope glycoprotein [Palo verde broom virus]
MGVPTIRLSFAVSFFLISIISGIYMTRITSVKKKTLGGKCNYLIDHYEDNYLLCVTSQGCKIETQMVKFSDICYIMHLEDNMIKCCDNYMVVKRPDTKKPCDNLVPHSWCDFLIKMRKFFVTILVFLITYILKVPIIYMIRMSDMATSLVLKKKNKCNDCNQKYWFSHVDCKVNTKDRFEYNVIFLVILTLSLFVTPILANKDFDTYIHGDYTEFVMKDLHNHYVEFYNKQNHIKVYINESYIRYTLEYDHDIMRKEKDYVIRTEKSCESIDKCISKLEGQKLDPLSFASLKKAHDGFTCFLSDVSICMSCGVELSKFASVYGVVDVTPVISLNLQVNDNNSFNIVIDSKDDYVDNNFYIRYLTPIQNNIDNFVVHSNLAYTGNICNVPEKNCYGQHISRNGSVSILYNPIIEDDGHYSSTYDFRQCTDNEDLSLKQLKLYGHFFNNYVIKTTEFGHFSIGINDKMLLNDEKCEGEVKVTGMSSVGCFNCKSGFTLYVKFRYSIRSCGVIRCRTETYKTKTYVTDQYNTEAELRMFTDFKRTKVICNGVEKVLSLSEYTIGSHSLLPSHEKVDSPGYQALNDVIDHIKLDIKKRILTIMTSLLSVYLTYRMTKQVIKHRKKYLKRKRRDDGSYQVITLD